MNFTRKKINKIVKYLKCCNELGYIDIEFLGISKNDINYNNYYKCWDIEFYIKSKNTNYKIVKDLIRLEDEELKEIIG